MRCPHKPRKGKDLVTDVSGTQYLLFSCVLCGCDVVVKLDSDGSRLMKRWLNGKKPSNSGEKDS
jgi:hypothetical protein